MTDSDVDPHAVGDAGILYPPQHLHLHPRLHASDAGEEGAWSGESPAAGGDCLGVEGESLAAEDQPPAAEGEPQAAEGEPHELSEAARRLLSWAWAQARAHGRFASLRAAWLATDFEHAALAELERLGAVVLAGPASPTSGPDGRALVVTRNGLRCLADAAALEEVARAGSWLVAQWRAQGGSSAPVPVHATRGGGRALDDAASADALPDAVAATLLLADEVSGWAHGLTPFGVPDDVALSAELARYIHRVTREVAGHEWLTAAQVAAARASSVPGVAVAGAPHAAHTAGKALGRSVGAAVSPAGVSSSAEENARRPRRRGTTKAAVARVLTELTRPGQSQRFKDRRAVKNYVYACVNTVGDTLLPTDDPRCHHRRTVDNEILNWFKKHDMSWPVKSR